MAEDSTTRAFNTSTSQLEDHYNTTANSTSNLPTTTSREEYILQKILYVLYMFFVPTMLSLGFCGNVLSCLVFSLTPLKKLSSSVYLVALALSDNGFILTYIISWLPFVNIRIFHEPGWCQIVLYLTYVFSFLSVWYVCAFTVERFLVVFYPLRRHVLCTNRRAKVVVVSLAGLAASLYTFPLWTNHSTVENGIKVCVHKPQYHNLLTYVGYVDTVVTLVIPFLFIIVLNCKICFALVNNNLGIPRRGDSLGIPRQGDSVGSMVTLMHSVHSNASQRARQHDSQQKVTKMLITVSTTFIVLNLPSHAIRFYIYCMHIAGKAPSIPITTFLYQHIFQTLFYMNYAINFVLYSLVGNNFRANLKLLFLFLVKRNRRYLVQRPVEVRTFTRPVTYRCTTTMTFQDSFESSGTNAANKELENGDSTHVQSPCSSHQRLGTFSCKSRGRENGGDATNLTAL